jgi:hypothetical protein
MAEQQLQLQGVGSVFEHVRGAGTAQGMGRDGGGEPGGFDVTVEDLLECGVIERLPGNSSRRCDRSGGF